MVHALEKVYFRSVGALSLFAAVIIAVMIIGGMAATIVVFAPGANAAPPDLKVVEATIFEL